MAKPEPLRLHVPEPTGRPGTRPISPYLLTSPAGAVRRPPVDTSAGRHRRPRAQRWCACSTTRAAPSGPGTPTARVAELLRQGLRGDDADARLRRPHADRAAPEEDVVLHAEPRRGGDRQSRTRSRSSRATCASRPTASRACCSRATTSPMVEMICQLMSNERDPLQRPPAAGDVFVQARRLLLDLPATSRRSSSRRSAGRWPRRSRATRGSPSAWIGDGATAEADFHTALTFAHVYRAPVILERRQQPVGDLDLPGDRRRRRHHVRGARRRLRHRVAARRRQRLPRGLRGVALGRRARARATSAPTLIEWVTYRAGAALDVGRPVALPAGRRLERTSRSATRSRG